MRGLTSITLIAALSGACIAQPVPPAEPIATAQPLAPAQAIGRAVEATFVVPESVARRGVDPREAARRVDQAGREFERMVDAAGSAMSAAERDAARTSEEASIEAKLAAIAADRQQRPEVYEEIFERYIRGQNRPWQSQHAPRPEREHEVESYRLAWEFYLLRPRTKDASPRYEATAAEAIGTIGNPRSAVTLLHAVRVATRPEARPEMAQERQRLALGALAATPSPEAARAIAESLVLIDTQRQRHPEAARRWDPVDFLVLHIKALPAVKRNRWPALERELEGDPRAPVRRFSRELQTRLRVDPS